MLGLLSALMSKEQQLQLNCLALDLRRCQQSLKNDSEGIVRERIESVWLQEILKKKCYIYIPSKFLFSTESKMDNYFTVSFKLADIHVFELHFYYYLKNRK